MDNEQAIKMLRSWNKDLSLMEDEEDGIKCHEMAISALEKQIPKKTIRVTVGHNGSSTDGCPICKKDFYEKVNFCMNCGQAIDWS